MLKYFFALMLTMGLFADVSVSKSASILKAKYPNNTIYELKQKVLEKAKLKASNEIYGEFMATQSVMEDGHVVDDVIRLISGGIIHIKGKPKFRIGDDAIYVTINAYATDADLSKEHITIPIAKENKKTIPKKSFIGLWYGFVMDKNGNSSSVEISIANFAQTIINYKSSQCAGDLIVQEKNTQRVVFKEILTFGKDRCKNNSIITLQKITPKSLEYIQQNRDEILLKGRIYLRN